MSNIASAAELKQSTPQLPVSWYFDRKIFELEQKRLFQTGPAYVGHELMVPNMGDYQSLSWMDHAKLLVRNAGGSWISTPFPASVLRKNVPTRLARLAPAKFSVHHQKQRRRNVGRLLSCHCWRKIFSTGSV